MKEIKEKNKKEEKLPVAIKSEVDTLIAKAIDKNVPVETMEKLLAMRRELKQEWAREQFNQGLSDFQAECPEIVKTVAVKEKEKPGKVRYKYAPLDEIVRQTKGLLRQHGFSYSFDAKFEDGAQIITCTARHIAGHSETATFRSPVDRGAFMTEIQKHGAAMTFAKRYAFCQVFGIMTTDADIDGQEKETEKKEGEKARSETIIAIRTELKKYDEEINKRVTSKLTPELTQAEADKIFLTLKIGEGIENHRLKSKEKKTELTKQQILALKFYGYEKLGFKGSHTLTELEKKEGRKKVLSTKDPEQLGNIIDDVKLLVKGRKEIETAIQNKMDWRKADKIDATILKALAALPMKIRVDIIRRIDFLAGKDKIVKLITNLKG